MKNVEKKTPFDSPNISLWDLGVSRLDVYALIERHGQLWDPYRRFDFSQKVSVVIRISQAQPSRVIRINSAVSAGDNLANLWYFSTTIWSIAAETTVVRLAFLYHPVLDQTEKSMFWSFSSSNIQIEQLLRFLATTPDLLRPPSSL